MITGPWQHRHLLANGIRFHLAAGLRDDAGAPLILLLHGFGEFWWAWRHQIPVLNSAGYRVAALDLRGYGATDKTPTGYDPQTTAHDIAGVIGALGHQRAVIVGHDLGAMAAWSTLALAPERVCALATISSPHPLTFPWRRMLADLAYFPLPILPERRIMADNGAYIEALLRSRARDQAGLLTAAEAKHYREALLSWPSPHRALAYQRGLMGSRFSRVGREFRQALRARAAVPLLSIHGAMDPLVPLGAVRAAQEYVVGETKLIELPEVGHMPHEETPDQVNALLLEWLADLV